MRRRKSFRRGSRKSRRRGKRVRGYGISRGGYRL